MKRLISLCLLFLMSFWCFSQSENDKLFMRLGTGFGIGLKYVDVQDSIYDLWTDSSILVTSGQRPGNNLSFELAFGIRFDQGFIAELIISPQLQIFYENINGSINKSSSSRSLLLSNYKYNFIVGKKFGIAPSAGIGIKLPSKVEEINDDIGFDQKLNYKLGVCYQISIEGQALISESATLYLGFRFRGEHAKASDIKNGNLTDLPNDLLYLNTSNVGLKMGLVLRLSRKYKMRKK